MNPSPPAARWLLAVLVLMGFAGESAQAALKPERLRTEYLVNPVAVDTALPRLSWQVTSNQRGQRQSAYRILVSGDRATLDRGRGDLWDSGKVATYETVNIVYAGRTLRSGQACFWKLKVWDGAGAESEWSEVATWGVGLLRPSDWKAEWIAHRDPTPLHTNRSALHLPPARHYRKDFRASPRVVRAVLYVSALGLVETHLNGQRVGDGYFEPGWADYRQRAYYRAHDVTRLISRGANRLGAIVAEGWYSGYVGYGLLVGYGPHRTGRDFYGRTPALLAQLEIEYSDGSRDLVISDSSWEVTADGPIREADLIMGEAYDARRESPEWCVAGKGREWKWERAISAADNVSLKATFHDTLGPRDVELGFQRPPGLQAYTAPPIRITEELKTQRVSQPKPGVYIFDLGQNFAGFIRLKVKGAAGTRVQIRHGEMLHPDGRLMTENLRRARATDFYTLRGARDGETWQPRFTYHGFRYVELTGLPTRPEAGTVTGLVLHNDTPLTGDFACSDEVMTRFWKNTQWTQRANFIEVPTDCPQRDERLGWMGDAQIYIRTATFNADVSAFFTKWLDDVVEAQRDVGAYPDYCPYPMAHGAPGQTYGTAWTDAGVICPWTLWRVYGDTRIIERMWSSLTRFMEWRMQRSPDFRGRADGNAWGDWLNLNETTPIEFIDAAYFALDARLMAEMAAAIGRTDEAEDYRRLHGSIRGAFLTDYVREDATLAVDTQTAYALGIGFQLVPAHDVPLAATVLAQKVKVNDIRMATGFLGTKALLPALTAGGHHDLAVQLFQSRRFPSWGYEVVNGATTVWERWDSYTREFGFNGADGNQNASMNSFSHYAFGAVMEWAFRNLAGIDALEPGYRRIAIVPRPPTPAEGVEPPPLSWVRASYDSIRGRIGSAWRREGDRIAFEVTIPANTTALVRLPADAPDAVTESDRALDDAPNVTLIEVAEGRLMVEVGSGTYRFDVITKR